MEERLLLGFVDDVQMSRLGCNGTREESGRWTYRVSLKKACDNLWNYVLNLTSFRFRLAAVHGPPSVTS